MEILAEYDLVVRQKLAWPSAETEGAVWAVGCLFVPSFHAECAVSIASDKNTSALRVHSLSRSCWRHLCVRRGESSSDPIDFVEPALAIETIELELEASDRLRKMFDLCDLSSKGKGFGADGMGVYGQRFLPTPASFNWWSGEAGDGRFRFVEILHTAAKTFAKWEASTTALDGVSLYFHDRYLGE